MQIDPATLVDLDRYPILHLEGPRGQELLHAGRTQLAASGACELPGFLNPAALGACIDDARGLGDAAYHSEGYGTAYLEPPPDSVAAEHPRRYVGRYSVGVVAYDQFPATSPLRQLYEWDPFMRFIGEILERRPLYRYADPLGALNLAVMTDGDELQWHFDQTDFVVSLALQDADEGGDFEVAPLVRSASEEHYDEVQRVFDRRSERVERLGMTPGTLLIFAGRYSLHRVSPIAGCTPRLVALLAFDTKPGTCSTELLRLSRYGRVG